MCRCDTGENDDEDDVEGRKKPRSCSRRKNQKVACVGNRRDEGRRFQGEPNYSGSSQTPAYEFGHAHFPAYFFFFFFWFALENSKIEALWLLRFTAHRRWRRLLSVHLLLTFGTAAYRQGQVRDPGFSVVDPDRSSCWE